MPAMRSQRQRQGQGKGSFFPYARLRKVRMGLSKIFITLCFCTLLIIIDEGEDNLAAGEETTELGV